ncbi:MAG: hypothetical protein JKY51_05815 [Opitutaceae bacterium]|nr:hypothetical protein [Opitutaceae bacterium]
MKRILMVFLWFVVMGIAYGNTLNELCPVTTDEPVEPGITTTYQGVVIGFCCKKCLRKFKADPAAYIANLNLSPVEHAHEEMSSEGESHHEHGHSDDHVHAEEHNHAEEHDHATDHGTESETVMGKLSSFLGKLHVLIVHFPIALLIFAAGFELTGWVSKRPSWFFAAKLNFVFGALAAIVAASFGWHAARGANYPDNLDLFLMWHRWLGVAVAIIAFTGLVSLMAERLECKWGNPVYRIIVFVLAILIPITAHFGGSLIYGADYLF